jgi:hypothetical protein
VGKRVGGCLEGGSDHYQAHGEPNHLSSAEDVSDGKADGAADEAA